MDGNLSGFGSAQILAERIADRVRNGERTAFLLGAALTMPVSAGGSGVPGVKEMCRWLTQLLGMEVAAEGNSADYQELFSKVIRRFGQDRANQCVKRAVLAAHRDGNGYRSLDVNQDDIAKKLTDLECARYQEDVYGWSLNRATQALGDLLTRFPQTLGGEVFTTNFDPLIEMACEQSGGSAYSIALHSDGALPITHSRGARVVHLHGFWFGADTLHSANQVGRRRAHLTHSLSRLLEGTLLVVLGYGGWDDVMMNAIAKTLRDPHAKADVAWAFREDDPMVIVHKYNHVVRRLSSGALRGRTNYYRSVDIGDFLPSLRDRILNGSGQGVLSCKGFPAETLQRFLDIVGHRFYRQRHVCGSDEPRDIGQEVQQLEAWGDHVPIAAAVIAAGKLLYVFEKSLPQNPRERDDKDADFWPRRCLEEATNWLVGEAPAPGAPVRWRSALFHAKQGRRLLDQTIADAAQYACEAVVLFRENRVDGDSATALMRAGQAVHCVMRASGDNRLDVWSTIRAKLGRLVGQIPISDGKSLK